MLICVFICGLFLSCHRSLKNVNFSHAAGNSYRELPLLGP